MSVLINYYGQDNFWNAGPSDGSVAPNQVLINTNSTANLINGTLTFGPDVFDVQLSGNFQFNGPVNTLASVSGSLTQLVMNKNGVLTEKIQILGGTDMLKWLFPSQTIPQFLDLASTLDKGIVFVGSQAGTQFSDTLIGGKGRDFFTSFAGKSLEKDSEAYFNGRDGLDTAIFQGKLTDYKVAKNDFIYDGTNTSPNAPRLKGWDVEDSVALRNGDTALINVERLKFSDINVALDIAPNQTAGKVYMLYQATFNRTPDTPGLGYWIKQVDNGANITTDVAAFFVTSPEFVTKYGANPSVASYVNNLYLNVLGRPGEAGGVAYWNKELNAGTISRAAVLEAFATLPEGAALVANAIANGIQYQEWLG